MAAMRRWVGRFGSGIFKDSIKGIRRLLTVNPSPRLPLFDFGQTLIETNKVRNTDQPFSELVLSKRLFVLDNILGFQESYKLRPLVLPLLKSNLQILISLCDSLQICFFISETTFIKIQPSAAHIPTSDDKNATVRPIRG